MSFEEARKDTKNAVIATSILVLIGTLTIAFSVMTGGNSLVSVDEAPLMIVGMFLYAGLGIGIYFYSRVSAILLFIVLIIDKIIMWAETGRPSGIIITVIVLYYLGKGIGGTFAYHKLRKEADPDYKSTKWWMWFIGVPTGLIFMVLTVLGAFLTVIGAPETVIQTGKELGSENIQQLRDAGILNEDEDVVYFYSEDLFSILNAGNILTNQRVISYENVEGVDVYASPFDNIIDIEIAEEGSFFVDTLVYVYVEEGDDFYLLLSAEEGKDKLFIEALRNKIPEREESAGLFGENAA